MTAKPDTAAAITDARALLAALLASDWKELHVVTATREIFIACNGARANPMRASSGGLPSVGERPITSPPIPGTKRTVLKAPHVATLSAIAAEGSVVAPGGLLARLSVLGEESALAAKSNCIIESAEAATGSLLEFDQPILVLREVA